MQILFRLDEFFQGIFNYEKIKNGTIKSEQNKR